MLPQLLTARQHVHVREQRRFVGTLVLALNAVQLGEPFLGLSQFGRIGVELLEQVGPLGAEVPQQFFER